MPILAPFLLGEGGSGQGGGYTGVKSSVLYHHRLFYFVCVVVFGLVFFLQGCVNCIISLIVVKGQDDKVCGGIFCCGEKKKRYAGITSLFCLQLFSLWQC